MARYCTDKVCIINIVIIISGIAKKYFRWENLGDLDSLEDESSQWCPSPVGSVGICPDADFIIVCRVLIIR